MRKGTTVKVGDEVRREREQRDREGDRRGIEGGKKREIQSKRKRKKERDE